MLELTFAYGLLMTMLALPLLVIKIQSADMALVPEFIFPGTLLTILSPVVPLYMGAAFAFTGGFLVALSVLWTATVRNRKLTLNWASINLKGAKVEKGRFVKIENNGVIYLTHMHTHLEKLEELID